MPEIELPISALKRNPARVEPTSPAEITARRERRIALGKAYHDNPHHPIIVRDGDFMLVDGYERTAGLTLIGIDKARVTLIPADTPDHMLHEIAITTAFHRTGLSGYETASLAIKLRAATNCTKTALAEKLHVNHGWITKLTSLEDCPQEAQDMAREGKIGTNDWYTIATSPDQAKAVRFFKSGLRGKKLADAIKEDAAEPTDSDTVKLDSLKIIISGISISLKGEGLSLATVAKVLGDAEREAKAAVKDGQSAATFARVTKDRAKKGVANGSA